MLLGVAGLIGDATAATVMPWPENTVREVLPGGTVVLTTMNSYQHPILVAVLLAIVMPLVHELLRWKRRRSQMV